MNYSPMLELLAAGDWKEFQPRFDALAQWRFYPLLLETLKQLKHDALFVSHIHGLGHIERTILQGAFCAMEEELGEEDTRLLLECCSYHDVGRVNDWVDDLHGHRAAKKIGALTGRTGEELLLLQGAVDAHSRKDVALVASVRGYGPKDLDRAIALAQRLKDADGLDRVRLGDLDPRYLRREGSRGRVALSKEVFRRYQAKLGEKTDPFFSEETINWMRAHGEKPGMPPKG